MTPTCVGYNCWESGSWASRLGGLSHLPSTTHAGPALGAGSGRWAGTGDTLSPAPFGSLLGPRLPVGEHGQTFSPPNPPPREGGIDSFTAHDESFLSEQEGLMLDTVCKRHCRRTRQPESSRGTRRRPPGTRRLSLGAHLIADPAEGPSPASCQDLTHIVHPAPWKATTRQGVSM